MENYSVIFNNIKGVLNIAFKGQLTISNIDKITNSIKSNLTNPTRIKIIVDEVENLDLSFIQLIMAIKKTGKEKGFPVETSFVVSPKITSLLENAGLSELINK